MNVFDDCQPTGSIEIAPCKDKPRKFFSETQVATLISAARADEREKCARIVREQFDTAKNIERRMALAIASTAIRRGRNLTEAEKWENLCKAMEEGPEGDPDLANRMRAAAQSQEGGE